MLHEQKNIDTELYWGLKYLFLHDKKLFLNIR